MGLLSFSLSLFLDKQNSSISNKNSERINDNSLEHYFRNLGSKQGKPIGNIFGVHSQCRSRIFLSGSKWGEYGVAYFQSRSSRGANFECNFLDLGGMTILSTRISHGLTKLNTK
jgi:hypothetical protein